MRLLVLLNMNNFDILKEALPNNKMQYDINEFITILLENYFF